jgi:hypothetical protein
MSLDNQRRVRRTQVLKHAKILTADSARPIECVMCDVTSLGAGLRVPPTASLPQVFDLVFDSMLFSRSCEIRWRVGQRLGVAFL